MKEEHKNVDSVDINVTPEYQLKLVSREIETNEEEISKKIEQDTTVTYKYYEIAYNNEKVESVDTIEEAENVVNQIKEQKQENELNLTIVEKYTTNKEEVQTDEIELAKNNALQNIDQKQIEEEKKKQEEERIKNMPSINGIKLAVKPVSGTISSRYGVSSRIRSSNHTGLDIATAQGTPIKVVADGTVTNASYTGSYGNLVKVNHGNGIETWYAHTSKMYVKVGQTVKAGDVIAAVGSTGNSTGPHLHFEIRIDGKHVNPQNYLYK